MSINFRKLNLKANEANSTNEVDRKPSVSVNLIVYNGEKYVRQCVEHVKKQDYSNIKFRIFNNASTDKTLEIAKEVWQEVEVINFPKNYGLGGGFNRSLYCTDSKYVLGLCVDVLMDENFILRAVEIMEQKPDVGVLQAKILRFDYETNLKTNIIDTTGLEIYKSYRVVNRGHGEKDEGQYDNAGEIFCYEGAVPFFRQEALEDVKMLKSKKGSKYPHEYLDEDFVWYADELDLGWRMRMRGWKNWYDPSIIAWHDRQTTHSLSGSRRNFIKQRKKVSSLKRKLDFRNQRLAFIKNEFCVNILLHALRILKRELFLFVYFLIWEQSSLLAYWEILKILPKMLKKRIVIIHNRKTSAKDIRKFFK